MRAGLLLLLVALAATNALQLANKQGVVAHLGAAAEAEAVCTTCVTTPNKDCKLSDWMDVGECSCDTNMVVQMRAEIQAKTGTGLTCTQVYGKNFKTTQIAACVPQCDEEDADCELSDWYREEGDSSCDFPCGEARTVLEYQDVLTYATGSGTCATDGDYTEREVNCGLPKCDDKCTAQEWVAFTTCDADCGSGRVGMYRTYLNANGAECAPQERGYFPCNTQPCPVDCEWNAWSSWAPCDRNCGTGQTTRSRTVKKEAMWGGKCISATEETKPCNSHPCPVDCLQEPWSMWGDCSQSCNSGFQTRASLIVESAKFGGKACGAVSQTQTCNTQGCPVNCEVGAWTIWDTCPVACGGKGVKQSRSRVVTKPAANGGAACPTLKEEQTCGDRPCPVDCVTGPWSFWAPCTAKCGGGQTTRSREVLVYAANGGESCPNLVDYNTCNTHNCPVNCETTAWSQWSLCSSSCTDTTGRSGTQRRNRAILTNSTVGGNECGCIEQERPCNMFYCPQDCVVSDWFQVSDCSATCNGGRVIEERYVLQPARYGGAECPALVNVKSCNTKPCPVDCKVSDWSPLSPCSASCQAVGAPAPTRTHTREIIRQPEHGGKPCPPISETITCNSFPCPIPCKISDYTAGQCQGTCGKGSQLFTAEVVVPAQYGGAPCPDLVIAKECELPPCAHDCKSTWSAWGLCYNTRSKLLHKCGTGGSRTRTVVHLEGECPISVLNNTMSEPCNTHDCPKDCELSAWSAWSGCSKSCGNGFQKRTRKINVAPCFGGLACGQLQEIRTCSSQACPVPCVMSAWSPWDDCTQSCDSSAGEVPSAGVQTRHRFVLLPAANGAAPCQQATENRQCNARKCPIDCVVSEWSVASSCSAQCGEGVSTQTRTIKVHPSFGGRACPELLRITSCEAKKCPVDCVLSDWTLWTQCSATCGVGTKTRSRVVMRFPNEFGATCDAELFQKDTCKLRDCPQDCVYSSWGAWSVCSPDGVKRRERTIISEAAFGGKMCSKCLIERDECTPPVNPNECDLVPCTNDQPTTGSYIA